MSTPTLTVDTLMRILRESAGESNTAPQGDPLDVEFPDLGYDSLALLEATARINREYGVKLDDDRMLEATTPRQLLAVVNDAVTDR